MTKVLVTGGYGQLGTKFSEKIRQYSNDFTDFTFYFPDHKDFDLCDNEKMESKMREIKPDIVVNFAAYTDVNKAEDDEVNAFEVNAYGVRKLAYLCKDYGAFLIHISTDFVFPGDKTTPLKEDDKRRALNAYGRSKNWGEVYIEDSGCEHIIIRTSWLYSDTQHKNFVKAIAEKLLFASTTELYVVIDEVGSPTYAGDLAEFIIKVLLSDYKSKQGIYHFCNNGAVSRYDFAKAIQDILYEYNFRTKGCVITPVYYSEGKVKRPHYSAMDNRKAELAFDFKIPYWRDSLKLALFNFTSDDNGKS